MRKYVIAYMTTSYEDTLREHTFGILYKAFNTREEAKEFVANEIKRFEEEFRKNNNDVESNIDGYYSNEYYYTDLQLFIGGELTLFYQYKIMEIKV